MLDGNILILLDLMKVDFTTCFILSRQFFNQARYFVYFLLLVLFYWLFYAFYMIGCKFGFVTKYANCSKRESVLRGSAAQTADGNMKLPAAGFTSGNILFTSVKMRVHCTYT